VLYGGPQERERRPGTHDVAAVVGMAAALDVASRRRSEEWAAVAARRDRLAQGLVDAVPGLTLTAPGSPKLPGSCHVRIGAVHQEELLVLLDDAGVCASAGSACASGAMEPSHVLLAMGMSPEQSSQAVRFSLGWTTSEDDVDVALAVVAKSVEQLRRS